MRLYILGLYEQTIDRIEFGGLFYPHKNQYLTFGFTQDTAAIELNKVYFLKDTHI